MDSNMTFRIDSEVKAQMAAICDALGMSTSTAFNIFANAFVRAKACLCCHDSGACNSCEPRKNAGGHRSTIERVRF